MQTCPLCQRAPRVGETQGRIRMAPADFNDPVVTAHLGLAPENPRPKAGLYPCCQDCIRVLAPIVLARVKAADLASDNPKLPAELSEQHLS